MWSRYRIVRTSNERGWESGNLGDHGIARHARLLRRLLTAGPLQQRLRAAARNRLGR